MTEGLERAAVIDLDEDTALLVDGASSSACHPPPRTFDRPVVVVRAGGPSAEALERAHPTAPYGVHGADRFAACAAASARRGAIGEIEICELTWTAARVARARTDGARITAEPHRLAAGLDGDSFVAGLTAVPAARTALREALTDGGGFLVEACSQAAEDHLFRDVQAVPEDPSVTAGGLLDALEAYRAALAPLLAPAGAVERTLLAGAFAAFPLIARIVRDETGRAPLVVPGAVAEGALLLAGGAYAGPAVPSPAVRLPLHRRRAGMPEDLLVALPSGAGEFAVLEGADLHVAKGGTGTGLPLGGTLPLVVDGTPREIDVTGLPAGRYRLGVRHTPADGTLLVLAADAGNPLFLSLTERSARS